MNGQTRTREAVLMTPLWSLLLSIAVLGSFGFQLLCYFRDSWFPFWVTISVFILFGLLCVACAIHITIVVSRNELPSFREVAFKPNWFWYLLFGSITSTVVSWGVALIFYNLLWFFVVLGTTMFMVGCCSVGIKRAVR